MKYLGDITEEISKLPDISEQETASIQEFIFWMGEHKTIAMQEIYVQTFDITPEHDLLHLTHHLFGDVSSMIALTEWVKSVATLSVNPNLIQDVSLIFKIHIFFGMTVFLVFPFTRLVHVWSIPLNYITRPYQIVRTKHVRMN